MPAGVMVLGPCVDLGPSGLTFAAPALVTLPYDETRLARLGLDESRVEVVTLPSEAGASWRRLAVTARDAAANTVTVEASHFSLFAPVTPADLGCVWVLKFFIEQIDCGEQSTDGFISPFGDTDIDVSTTNGAIFANETHSASGLPYTLSGAGTPGGSVNFTVIGEGVSPGPFGASVGSADHLNMTFNGFHDGFNLISGLFTGGATYTYLVDPADPESGTFNQRCDWSGHFTVDIARATDLAASNTLFTKIAPDRLVTCLSRPVYVTARPSATGVPISKMKYSAPDGVPADGAGESFLTTFSTPGIHVVRAGMCGDAFANPPADAPADVEMEVNVVQLRDVRVVEPREGNILLTVNRGATGETLLCAGDFVNLHGFSEAAENNPGGPQEDPLAPMVRYHAPGATQAEGAGPKFSLRYASPGLYDASVTLCEDESVATVRVRVPDLKNVTVDKPEVCPGELFTATLEFDVDVTEELLSHVSVDRDALQGDGIDSPSHRIGGHFAYIDLRLDGFIGGGPRVLRFRCGTDAAETTFIKVGVATAVLQDLDNPSNTADVTAGQFALTTFLGANNLARVSLQITTEPAGREAEFQFGFKPINGVMPPVGDFKPGGAEVRFSEAGDFEIAAKCKEDLAPLAFGFGPHVHIVDLLGVKATDDAHPLNFVDFPRRDPTNQVLVVAPGSVVALNTLTDETGHEQDVQFEVSPGATANPASGFFPAGGRTFVAVGFDPVYTIRVYHDKDGNGVWGGNDPFVDATVWTVPPAIPIQVTGDDGYDHADSSKAFPDYILVTTVVNTGEMIDLEAIFEDLSPRGGQVAPLARAVGSAPVRASGDGPPDGGTTNVGSAPVRASQRSAVADPETPSASSRLGVSSAMSQRSAAVNPGNGRDAPGRPEAPG
ncbi:MAG: hypothetical protein HY719_13975, partial [Planctomycetes bacterium]|nr:hypothetical protein [Planctomycetota bacterium]